MTVLSKSRYKARIANCQEDVRKAQNLRAIAFGVHADSDSLDQDAFDPICTHFLIEDSQTDQLMCCFRLLSLSGGREIDQSYSAQFYELTALTAFQGRMAEIGRFCIHPDAQDPDVLRVAWGAMTRYVDENNIKMLFGCSSFQGVDADIYLDAFVMLKDRFLAPKQWLPRVKSPSVFRFAQKLRLRKVDTKTALLCMPPLLRTYLGMGGWVSDHAVVDRQLGTLHVFTGLEIQDIPPARKRLLRAAVQ